MKDDFDYLIVYSLACTLEESDVYAMRPDKLMFESLHVVINVEQVGCIGQGKGGFKQGSKQKLNMSIGSCLERGKTWRRLPRTRKRKEEVGE